VLGRFGRGILVGAGGLGFPRVQLGRAPPELGLTVLLQGLTRRPRGATPRDGNVQPLGAERARCALDRSSNGLSVLRQELPGFRYESETV